MMPLQRLEALYTLCFQTRTSLDWAERQPAMFADTGMPSV